jgi:acetoin utilization protein AcuB
MSRNIPVKRYMTPAPFQIDRAATLSDAHALMREYRVRHLPVLQDDKLVGIVTLRDLHLIETLMDIDPEQVPVEDAMTEDLYTVGPDEPIDQIAEIMAERRLGSAIIVDRGSVVGIFTTTDALGTLLELLRDS